MCVTVTCTDMGYNTDYSGWRYDFTGLVDEKQVIYTPIIVPDSVPQQDRRDQAIRNFGDLLDALAVEARNL
ncbi:hypothetical protein [Caenispirillum bisanense]|uniref:hypothetical protein n=1 Tax=Caenispirillum bisanense TaxID=414052 RepID=UPI000BE38916|nr:hypothetical protein [Caenispirillum bisanense]